MCKRFDEWAADIKEYCEKNNLSFEKAKQMSQSSNKTMLLLQYYNPNSESVKKGMGLLDETPMPAVLWITKNGDRLEFEQTEYTQRYLAAN